jgi:hypothetical protein
MATEKRQKRVRLTCQCGMSYTLNTIYDLQSRCTNERCRATLNMTGDKLWEYQETIIALMGVLGLGREYGKELGHARRMSKKLASPYTIAIIEVP